MFMHLSKVFTTVELVLLITENCFLRNDNRNSNLYSTEKKKTRAEAMNNNHLNWQSYYYYCYHYLHKCDSMFFYCSHMSG